ncbi:MAG: hypothetical protein WA958_03190, partial [Tunicatimonas sp.]
KLEGVSYLTSFEGLDDYTDDPETDFDYLPVGALHFRLSNANTYCVADYNTTKLGTSGVGIKVISNDQTNLTQGSTSNKINRKWKNYLGQKIGSIRFYIKKETWTNHSQNEEYPESVEIKFDNGKSIFYFCGDVDDYSKSKGRYELIGGRDSGIIFFDKTTFERYDLHKIDKIESEYVIQC